MIKNIHIHCSKFRKIEKNMKKNIKSPVSHHPKIIVIITITNNFLLLPLFILYPQTKVES